MDAQILDSVTEWDTVPVGDGSAGLADLVGRDFTGAVTDGVGWLFLLNGRGVGVVDGSVDDFGAAELTAHEAPDDSLPLLYAMMSGAAETRAKYYTEETPLSAAHETLSNGGFTGFVELSENVLSGDYYVVYYGGRSLPVAFVGSSRKLLTGDEAFERADDEVGIYRVRDADVEILDLPTSEETATSGAGDAGDTDAGESGTNEADVAGFGVDSADAGTSEFGDDVTNTDTDTDADADADDLPFDATAALDGSDRDGEHDTDETQAPDAGTATETDVTDAGATTDVEEPDAGEADESVAPDGTEEDQVSVETEPTDGATDEPDEESAATHASDATAGTGADESATEEPGSEGGDPDDELAVDSDADDSTPDEATAAETDRIEEAESEPPTEPSQEVTFGGSQATDPDGERVFAEEAEWRETQVIPPLSPDDEAEDVTATSPEQPERRRNADAPTSGESTASTETTNENLDDLRTRLEEAETAREEAEERVAALETERDEAESEREDLRAERDELRAEVRRLRERIEELESTIERLENGGDESETRTASMTEESALAGTSLFVRYRTKGEATLERAHAGDATRDEVNQNLRLEYHTTFESDPVTVGDDGFETFLYDSIEYRFVKWLVEEFTYELQSTGNTGSMQELYDVLPEIDRIEFRANVSLRYEEDGQENREQREFDIVFRDRMGNALAVAEINDSREATSEGELTALVEGTRRLAETTDTVAAAFAVTASFFDPAALEVASEATKSGLLGRSKGKSYVKLSRKRGFHLCLVETRHADFHVNVPEL